VGELADAKKNISKENVEIINTMEPSLSAFLIYLGLNKQFKDNIDLKSHVWIIENNYDNIEKIFQNLSKGIIDYIALSSATQKADSAGKKDKESMFVYTSMPFESQSYWTEERKDEITGRLIKIAGRLITNIDQCIDTKIVATPNTLYKWTLNHMGACYGLADTISQFGNPDFSEKSFVTNLFRVGHWANISSGITSVTNSGHKTALRIIRNINTNNS